MKHLLLFLIASSLLPAQNAFEVKVSGHGQPMILIPGLSSGGGTWDSTVEHYKDHYECHVLTLAGFVGVPRIPAPMLETVRDAVAAYIREKKLVKPVIVGHSLGGFLALEIGEKYPDLVGPLVIVDSYPFMVGIYDQNATIEQGRESGEQARKYMGGQSQDMYERYVKSGVATRMLTTKDADFEQLIAWGLKTDRTAAADAMAEMFSTDLRGDLPRIKSRTLVMGAWASYKEYGADHDKTLANLKLEYTKLDGVEIRLNDTSRHFIMWDDPNWMFAQMDAFFGGL
jgi:N-formylmaleamate deformylase